MKMVFICHHYRLMPTVIGLVALAMVVGVIVKGRGSRGSCTYDGKNRKVICKIKQLRQMPKDITESAMSIYMGKI